MNGASGWDGSDREREDDAIAAPTAIELVGMSRRPGGVSSAFGISDDTRGGLDASSGRRPFAE
jgi:hypothetical protein